MPSGCKCRPISVLKNLKTAANEVVSESTVCNGAVAY